MITIIVMTTPRTMPAAETLYDASPSCSADFLSSRFADVDLFWAITATDDKFGKK